ncbi:tubby-like F-box protein 6 isoform X1 [Lactuca sativa]|uniref:Tubby-like F-box protein n=2 Tax=Lactuca sativa TaxID=4236 RepID=A0A9R1X757_LACSA|nr:tubby-like F-box protein 6 isoform X1 [Lactuca sativa]KAJ0203320.1 hypothetical protein LSAT_V11C500238760 [Lactuca sativa]
MFLNMSLSCLLGSNTNRRIQIMKNGKSHIVPENYDSVPRSLPSSIGDSKWDDFPGELLLDIIRRVEGGETSWPGRRDIVACASVCRFWRNTVKQIVRTPEQCGLITFPMSLKQPGSRKDPIQCFIRRDRANSIFRLFLGLSPALAGDASKLLLAAKKVRKATGTEFSISLTPDEFSKSSLTYVGKLSSNFLGTKFAIHDVEPFYDSSTNKQIPKFGLKKVSPVFKSKVVTISYELNVLRTRGPRRMNCTMNSIPDSGQAGKKHETPESVIPIPVVERKDSLVLRNKAPRWHEQLQCWCLNFKGRVTVASVKNFQLAVDSGGGVEEDDVVLQFGKIGKDIFTMDYRYPLSAFQAFAICLSSFDTKPACE